MGTAVGENRYRVAARAARAVDDRVMVVASSRLTTGLVPLLTRHGAISGLAAVGATAASTCRTIHAVAPGLFVAADTEAYSAYQATPTRPFQLPEDDGALFSCGGLPGFIEEIAGAADVVYTPTGLIRVGDVDSLAAVVTDGSEVEHPACVVSVPAPADWLRRRHVEAFIGQLSRCRRPVALTVVSQLDPFDDSEVADGLLQVAALGNVVHHRTDMTAVQVVPRGALAATIGVTASLRHTVPPMRRPATRRRSSTRALAVFVPGIDEFRDVAEVECWWGDSPPACPTPECCGRKLTDFDPDSAGDREAAELHNVTSWLTVVERMLLAPDRMVWLRDYRRDLAVAYDALRLETGVRAIRPYASARHWLSLTD